MINEKYGLIAMERGEGLEEDHHLLLLGVSANKE